MKGSVSVVRNIEIIPYTISKATVANNRLITGIGGPQTREERPAVATRETAQTQRICRRQFSHQKQVIMVAKLINPHNI